MIKVLLFEDNPQLAEGLHLLIDSVDTYTVVGCHDSLTRVEDIVKTTLPDVILMDIGFPESNGIEALRKIKKIQPSTCVLMLTGKDDDNTIFEAIKAGADGYLLKKTPPLKLLEHIREAYEGGAPMTPWIARKILQTFNVVAPTIQLEEDLTAREREVLRELVNGLSYKMVSAKLNIAIDTVRSHIKSIYFKLQVNSKSEAIVKAMKNNLV
jgi:DNA-binding NarL/FixJ family response regulator